MYVPPAEMLTLAAQEAATVAVATAPLSDRPAGGARLIAASEHEVRTAGIGNWSRTIRTILGSKQDAGRLVLGETVNPPGNWSSYPPHKHDRQAPPDEVALEEVYYYRFKPRAGFGVQLLYDDSDERAQIVRDGDVVAIPSGYHPVVAAPGYSLYYLWVLAGAGRGPGAVLRQPPCVDPGADVLSGISLAGRVAVVTGATRCSAEQLREGSPRRGQRSPCSAGLRSGLKHWPRSCGEAERTRWHWSQTSSTRSSSRRRGTRYSNTGAGSTSSSTQQAATFRPRPSTKARSSSFRPRRSRTWSG